MRYLIDAQAYNGGPWNFKAQFGEKHAFDDCVAGIIGNIDEYDSVTVKRGDRFTILTIERRTGGRERYRLRTENN